MVARLVPLSEGSVAVPLDKAITLIGRHPDCDAVLDDNQKISRRHCCIAQVENRLVLRDLGSMNGVRVNGEPVVEVDLQEGDEITIGDEEFMLELKSDVETSKRVGAGAPKTPSTPKRSPKPASLTPPLGRKTPVPVDISQNFPVPIPEEDEESDDEIQLNLPASPPPLPESAVNKLILNFPDAAPEDDNGVFKLDSGILDLGDLENNGK